MRTLKTWWSLLLLIDKFLATLYSAFQRIRTIIETKQMTLIDKNVFFVAYGKQIYMLSNYQKRSFEHNYSSFDIVRLQLLPKGQNIMTKPLKGFKLNLLVPICMSSDYVSFE